MNDVFVFAGMYVRRISRDHTDEQKESKTTGGFLRFFPTCSCAVVVLLGLKSMYTQRHTGGIFPGTADNIPAPDTCVSFVTYSRKPRWNFREFCQAFESLPRFCDLRKNPSGTYPEYGYNNTGKKKTPGEQGKKMPRDMLHMVYPTQCKKKGCRYTVERLPPLYIQISVSPATIPKPYPTQYSCTTVKTLLQDPEDMWGRPVSGIHTPFRAHPQEEGRSGELVFYRDPSPKNKLIAMMHITARWLG